MKTYLTVLAMCLLVQVGFGQKHKHTHVSLLDKLNLLQDPSCEAHAHAHGEEAVNTWQATITNLSGRNIVRGGRRTPPSLSGLVCFDATGFKVTSAMPAEGDFFYADAPDATLTKLTQVVDLKQDRGGENFFYAYQYRMADNQKRLHHKTDVIIEYKDVSGNVLGILHERTDFTHRAADEQYVVKSGTSTAPAGTRFIQWTVQWKDGGDRNHIIFDDFWLGYNDPSRHCVTGLHGSPYSCFSDPNMLSGDVIEMTCEQFFDEEFINKLVMINPTKACDADGTVAITRPGGNAGGSGALADMNTTRRLVFEYKNSSPLCQQPPLILNVRLTGDCPPPAFAETTLPTVAVPCGYDLENDPAHIIGTPEGKGAFEFEDVGNVEECGGQIVRTWTTQTNPEGEILSKEQIINIGVITVYRDRDYTGDLIAFEEGLIYTNRVNIRNSDRVDFKKIRSIKVAPGYQVTTYSSKPLSESSGKYTADIDKITFNPRLRSSDTNALEITKIGEEISVVIYRDDNERGDYQHFIGEQEVNIDDLIFGRETSSFLIKTGYQLVVFTEPDFKGESFTFTSDLGFMRRGFNDRVASFKIIKSR